MSLEYRTWSKPKTLLEARKAMKAWQRRVSGLESQAEELRPHPTGGICEPGDKIWIVSEDLKRRAVRITYRIVTALILKDGALLYEVGEKDKAQAYRREETYEFLEEALVAAEAMERERKGHQ